VSSTDSALCWGWNGWGQLGDGTRTDAWSPVAVASTWLKTAKKIATGSHHTCAISGDDDVYCWGYNGDGALGLGANQLPIQSSPVPVQGL
jgi:alpha-tubulin suppressor-like RCC1 family protein